MISYNFPYRGPFEYDKATISILSYLNEANVVKSKLNEESAMINELTAEVDKAFNEKISESKSRKAFMMIEKIR